MRPKPLRELETWLRPFSRPWSARLDALERHLDRTNRISANADGRNGREDAMIACRQLAPAGTQA